MKKKVVVFGASGETGRYFVDYFLDNADKENYELIAVGTRKTSFFEETYDIQYCQVNISTESDFDKLPQEVYAVVHLAGYMPARMSGYDPFKHLNVNIIGTLNVLEYCRKARADRILFTQSFGDIKDHADQNILLTVDLTRMFSFKSDHSVYVIAKNASVDLIEHYHQMYGLKRFIFRLPTIYLYSKDRTFFVDGIEKPLWYRVLIDKALKGEDLEVWGDYRRKKDLVYVKDFCQMLWLAIISDRSSGYYNVGTGIGTSLLDQFKGIKEVFNPPRKKSNLIFLPDMPDTPQYIMDITPAKEELGYIPKYFYIEYLNDYKKEMELERFKDL